MAQSRFFAYLERLRWIKRWGLKRNVIEENVMEHSWQVAIIAHALAVIHNRVFDGDVDANRVAVAALYHDASEVITGDLPSPIKYHSEAIKTAYKAIESEAELELYNHLPDALQGDFEPLLQHEKMAQAIVQWVKAADIISAYIKCQSEISAGNSEFNQASQAIERRIRDLALPEVDYFMSTFVDSYLLTLDELLEQHDRALF